MIRLPQGVSARRHDVRMGTPPEAVVPERSFFDPYQQVQPPSTTRLAPVMYEEASLAKKIKAPI